jgi:predicted lysophospholipase L1 biosynthesis ABC-type transport system permease subunit
VQAGTVGVAAFSIVGGQGDAIPIHYALTDGRAPVSDDEIAVGPKTLQDLQSHIGDTIAVGDERLPLRVVGTALFPPDVHAEFDEGLWLTDATFERLVSEVTQGGLSQGAERYVLVRYPRGVDASAATVELGNAMSDSGASAAAADVPVELQNLHNVRTLPVLLAVFLGLLAVAAVAHVLVSSSQRRRRDFAVLRAIGFNRRGTRSILNVQASTISLVGLAIGVPLGVAAGRTVWHWVADQVPLEDVPPLAVVAVLLVLPATIVLANALALWPARTVARLAPGDVLRAE